MVRAERVSGLVVPPATPPGRVVFEVLSGSHAYGTAGPSSDGDWRGVYLLPDDAFLGLDRAQTTWEDRPNDQVFWELGHFCRLLLKGNPNLVSMLFTPPRLTVESTPVIAGLLPIRRLFVSQSMRSAYMGWIHKELVEIARLHKGSAKRLSHVPRLMYEYETALRTGTLEVVLEPMVLRIVRAIKFGELAYETAVALVGEMLLDLEEVDARLGPGLPDPPTAETLEFLLDARRRYGRQT